MRRLGTTLRTCFYRKIAVCILSCCLIIVAAAISPAIVWPNGKGSVNANLHVNPNASLHGADVFAPVQGGINPAGIIPGMGGIKVSGQTPGGSISNSGLTNVNGSISVTNQNGVIMRTFKDKLLFSQPGSNIVVKIDSPPKGKSTEGKAENQSQSSDNRFLMAAGDVFSRALAKSDLSSESSINQNTYSNRHRHQKESNRWRYRHRHRQESNRWRHRRRRHKGPNPDPGPDPDPDPDPDPVPAPEPAPLAEVVFVAAEEEEFDEGGCPALMEWLAGELGATEDIQVFVANTFSHSTDIQPCNVTARLKNTAKVLTDSDSIRIAALERVINEFVTTPAPLSEEQMALISAALAEHSEDETYYAAAGEWIDALAEYVSILSTDLGYGQDDSTAVVMEKYGMAITWTGNVTLSEFVQLQASKSVEN